MAATFDPYRKWLGIPSDEQPPNHYRLLGVPLLEEDPEVIENAAHRQMAYVRTFQSGPHAAESQKLLNELASAKVCLLNAEKKIAYDEMLCPRVTAPPPVPDAPPESPVVFAARGKRSAATKKRVVVHEARRRTSARRTLFWVPVLSGLGGVALIVVLVTTFALGRKPDSGTTPGAAKSSSSRDEDPPFGPRTPRTSFTPPRSGSSNGASRPPAFPSSLVKTKGWGGESDPSVTTSGGTEPRAPDRDERLRQQLTSVRDSLGRRDMSRLKSIATVASRPLRNGQLKAEVDQIQAVGRYLDEFWKAARQGLNMAQRELRESQPKEEAGDGVPKVATSNSTPSANDSVAEDQPAPPAVAPSDATPPEQPAPSVQLMLFDHALEIVEIDGDKVTCRVGGETRTAKLWELPSLDVAALAWHSLKQDDFFGRVYVAVFLCVDKVGDSNANVEYARKIATELADLSATSFPYLEWELRRALPSSDNAESPVAVIDRQPSTGSP